MAGILLPFMILLKTSRPGSLASEKFDPLNRLDLPWIPIVGGVFLLVLVSRFWKLGSLFAWPGVDEAYKGMLAFEWLKEGKGGFFYGFNQSPPSYIRSIALLLRLHFSPLLSLWLPPAIASFLSVGFCYGAARQFFPFFPSFLCAMGMAFSYWPLLAGRLGLEWSFILLWECLLFFLLGLAFRPPPGKPVRTGLLFLLGLVAGAGSLLGATWPIISSGIALMVLFLLAQKPPWIKNSLFFSMGLILSLIPFLKAVEAEDYGGHILSTLISGGSFKRWNLLLSAWDYISAFFWGGNAAYVPRSMGFFNPLWASFLLLGILELYRCRRDPRTRSIIFLFTFFCLPAFLLTDLEPFRLVQLLPLCLLIIGLGAQTLLSKGVGRKGPLILGLLWVLAGCLDGYRLVAPYGNLMHHPEAFASTGKSLEKLQAYRVLSEFRSVQGSGLIFSEFVPESGDLSLAYVTEPFNRFWEPGSDLSTFHWVGFLTSVHYAPYLSRRFPGMQGTLLPSQIPGRASDHFLGILSLSPKTMPIFQDWLRGYRMLWQADSQAMNLSNGKPRTIVLETLLENYENFPKDPFLQSCFFEKLLFNYSWEKTFHPEDPLVNGDRVSGVLREAYRQSCQDDALKGKFANLLALENGGPLFQIN